MRPAAPEATKIARIGGRRPPPADGVWDRAGAVPTATATPRGGEDGQARRLPDHAPPGNLKEVSGARWYARPAAGGRPQRGCSSMVELEPSKLVTRVRFPSPALVTTKVSGFPRPCCSAAAWACPPRASRTSYERLGARLGSGRGGLAGARPCATDAERSFRARGHESGASLGQPARRRRSAV